MNLRENYNKELQKVLQEEAKKAALEKGTIYSPKNDTGTRTFNDQGFTIFVQKVKVEKLPKIDFEGSVLKYQTTEPSVLKKKKKSTHRLNNKQDLDTDPFDAIRGNENNDGYFF